jgi:hypothetical protein
MAFSETTKRVRKFVLDEMVASGRAPNVGRIMRETGFAKDEVMQSLQDLQAGGGVYLEARTDNIRIVSPFANTTTPYEVDVEGERRWYAE